MHTKTQQATIMQTTAKTTPGTRNTSGGFEVVSPDVTVVKGITLLGLRAGSSMFRFTTGVSFKGMSKIV